MKSAVFIAAVLAFVALGPARAQNVATLKVVKGATVWFVEDHTVPMIAIEVSLPAGSAYDPPGKAGLADFAGDMLDEGAANLDSKAFHEALADRAIELSVTADRDYLDVTLRCQTAAANDAFRLLGLALQRPRFDSDAIARVRAQMLADIQDEDTEPGSVATKAFYAAYFGSHPYGHSPKGTAQGLNAVNQADLRNFARTHWVRSGLKIAVSGDASAALISRLIAAAFAPLPASTSALPPPFHPAKPATLYVNVDTQQPNAVFGLPDVARFDPHYMAAYLANDILGGNFSSRLTEEIRVKLGLTYDISTDVEVYHRASLITGQVATRRDSMRKTLAALRDVLKRFSNSGPTQQELDDAKSYVTGSFPLAFASNMGIVSQLAQFQQEGLPSSYLERRNSLVEAVTLDDVRKAARSLFDPSRLVVVVAGTLPNDHGAKQ